MYIYFFEKMTEKQNFAGKTTLALRINSVDSTLDTHRILHKPPDVLHQLQQHQSRRTVLLNLKKVPFWEVGLFA